MKCTDEQRKLSQREIKLAYVTVYKMPTEIHHSGSFFLLWVNFVAAISVCQCPLVSIYIWRRVLSI